MEVKEEQMQEIKEVKEEDKIGVKYINEQHQKFSKFEADYRQQLMAKYFADKNVFGGNIFDVKVNIDGQTATASRLPPFQSYLNPPVFPQSLSKVYPKVKVKAQKEEVDQYAYEKSSLESLKAFEWLTLNNFSSSDESPKSVVRVPCAYAPKTPPPSYLGSKDEFNTVKNTVEAELKQKNARPKSAPRPRAVLSSPVNDGIRTEVQSRRELLSAPKNKSCCNRHARCAVASSRIETLTSTRVHNKEATGPQSDVRARARPVQAEPSSRVGNLKKMLPSSLKR